MDPDVKRALIYLFFSLSGGAIGFIVGVWYATWRARKWSGLVGHPEWGSGHDHRGLGVDLHRINLRERLHPQSVRPHDDARPRRGHLRFGFREKRHKGMRDD